MQRILITSREIVRTNCPTNTGGLASIFGKPISGYIGDRAVIAENKLPAVAFDGEEMGNEFITFHAYQKDWQFSILGYTQMDEGDDAAVMLYRLTTMIERIFRQHTKIWVFEPCFFCGADFLNPTHLMTHSALSSYATTIDTEWQQRWNVTHTAQGGGVTPTPPTLNDPEKYAAAYYRFFESGTIVSPTPITFTRHGHSFTTSDQDLLAEYRNTYIQPVRFLSFVKTDNISYGFVAKLNNQYLRGSQIKVSAKEIDPIHIFGPNNVTTY